MAKVTEIYNYPTLNIQLTDAKKMFCNECRETGPIL